MEFSSHPSIKVIKLRCRVNEPFEFSMISEDMVKKEILGLNASKKASGSIPIKILKFAATKCAPALTKCFNDALLHSEFPEELKLADIVPIHKKGSTSDKTNYRPISLLPAVSKVFERLLANQLTQYMDTWLSKLLCGFRKGYRPQYALLSMIRNWQNCLLNKGKIGAILMDLSKAFDCLSHKLLIAKLEAYGIGTQSLRFLYSYLTNRKHRVRINSSFSEWLELLLGVPQGSVLGPILFNIFINDLLFTVNGSSICNFADDNTLYVCDSSLDNVLSRLNADMRSILAWFECNSLIANPEKFQLIFPGTVNSNIAINIGTNVVMSSDIVKLLGVKIDSQLTFDPHIKEVCKKASQKTRALLRLRNHLNQKQTDLLVNSYILSAFNFCPLVWMFCSKKAHDLINATHKRALCAKATKFSVPLDVLLRESNTVSIHTRNLRLLVIEIYKALNQLSPAIMWNTFNEWTSGYNLRRISSLQVPRIQTAMGSNTFDFRASLAWNNLPARLKFLNETDFKAEVSKCTI